MTLASPLSYLLLERYVLGELTNEEAAEVAALLLRSPQDRAVYESILKDPCVLPDIEFDVSGLARARTLARTVKRGGLLAACGGTLAAVVACGLLWWSRGTEIFPYTGAASDPVAVKGGEVALSILGQWSGANPPFRQEGEALKLRVTCPPGTLQHPLVVVRQQGEEFWPLPALETFGCGNLRPWPGAFTVSGEAPAELCLSWSVPDAGVPAALPGAPRLEVTCIAVPALVR